MSDDPRVSIEVALQRMNRDLGHGPLNKLWAKLEIFLGLLAGGGGLLIGCWAVSRIDPDMLFICVGLTLFVLGGYLALAGSRSHLYQSNNRLTAYLAEIIAQDKMKEKPVSKADT